MATTAVVPVQAAGFYAFGDSLTEAPGRRTLDENPIWVDLLPEKIGLEFDAEGPDNYAVGGALSNEFNRLRTGEQTGFLTQVDDFIDTGTTLTDDDVVGVWFGTNDIFSAVEPGSKQKTLGDQPDAGALANKIIENLTTGISELVEAGAKTFFVLSTWDLSQPTFFSEEQKTLATEYSLAYRDALRDLTVAGAELLFVDTYQLLEDVQADPDAFGLEFTDGLNSCLGLEVREGIPCTQENAGDYAFYESVHASSAFHSIVADEAAKVYYDAFPSDPVAVASVPVPAPLALGLTGLAALGLLRRRA